MKGENTMDEQTKVSIVDYTYKFEELVDQMEESVTNAEKVINEQLELIKIVKKADEKEMFKQFTEQLQLSIDDQLAKVNDCKERILLVKQIIEMCKNKETKDLVVKTCCLLLEGLGLEKRAETKNNA